MVRTMHTTTRPEAPQNRIRELREARNLARYDVAAALRVDQSTVARWERGGAIPDHRKHALAQLLDAEIAYLMGWDDEPMAA